MKESQAEIRAIQAKLQALQMGRSTLPTPTEPFSDRSDGATATINRARVAADVIATDVALANVALTNAALANTVQQRSTTFLQPQKPLLSTPVPNLAAAMQRLETQVERVNQLSLDQEAALLELKTIAEQIEHSRRPGHSTFEDALEEPIWECLAAAVPFVEQDETGTFVITTRSVDLYRAEREAVLMAQNLRNRSVASPRDYTSHRVVRRRSALTATERIDFLGQMWRKILSLLPARRSRRRPAPRLRPQPAPTTMTVQDAAIWIIGAIVARRGLDLLLAAFPHLWLPVVGLVVTPAVIAIYRTTFTPESGFMWGYRLFLVMVGLLIGGRL